MDSFKPVTLEDQQLFTKIFEAVKPVPSELSFPYLYMWRNDYNLSYAILEDHLCMISRSGAFSPYAFCPIPADGVRNDLKFKKALELVESKFQQKGLPLLLGRVEEARLPELRMAYGDRIEEEYLEDASDYVYEASDLIHLSGKKFSKKRNHISQFMREYGSFEYIPVDRSNVPECRRIFEEWCDKNEDICVDHDNCERLACYDLLDHWDRLPMKGALIKVAGKFEAFTIGELLNPETAVVHIEKANSDINGIYPLINQQFCAHEWAGVRYINREEDLGNAGLRKSKLSYNPVFMVKKFLVKVVH